MRKNEALRWWNHKPKACGKKLAQGWAPLNIWGSWRRQKCLSAYLEMEKQTGDKRTRNPQWLSGKCLVREVGTAQEGTSVWGSVQLSLFLESAAKLIWKDGRGQKRCPEISMCIFENNPPRCEAWGVFLMASVLPRPTHFLLTPGYLQRPGDQTRTLSSCVLSAPSQFLLF